MPRVALIFLVVAAASARAQATVEVRVGAWRASYTAYGSAADVCEAQPQWLADEMESCNQLLEAFLARATTRGGAWTEADLPLLEQAAAGLPKLVAAHELAVKSLPGCELGRTRLFPKLVERGAPLVKEAHSELDRLPELIRFIRHRQVLEKWEKARVEAVPKAKESCRDAKPGEPRVYFAYEDEFGVRRWFFCDESEVVAAPNKSWEHHPEPGAAKDARRTTMWIQAARLYPELSILLAPKP